MGHMPVKAEVVDGQANLPRASRRTGVSRVYPADSRWRGARRIGVIEQTDGVHVAHVVVPLRGADGIKPQLVKLTAEGDTGRDALVEEMRKIKAKASVPPSEPKITPVKAGLLSLREVGRVRTTEGLVVRDGVLQREARVRGSITDPTLARQRRPSGHNITVHTYDGTPSEPTIHPDIAAADVENQIKDIFGRQYRFDVTERELVRDGDRVIGGIVYGRESWKGDDGKNNERGVVAGYVVNNNGQLEPLSYEEGIRRVTTRINNNGRRARTIGAATAAVREKLTQTILTHAQERVELPRELIQAGAMHKGERDYQQDAFGINGSLHLGEIGGEGFSDEARIAALAEVLVGRDAEQGVKDAKIAEIKSLAQEVEVLISEGKIKGMAAVADGMGGAVDGQVASAIALYVFQREMVNGLRETDDIEQVATDAAEAANKVVFDYGSSVEIPEGKDRPQTGFAAYVIGPNNNVTFVKDADCRIYLEQGNNMIRVFADNSYVEQLVDSGNINPSEVFSHPYANLVTHSIGGEETSGNNLLVGTMSLPQGGRIILATDGVWGDFDRNTDRNQRILVEADATRNQRAAAWRRREGGRQYATDLAFGEIFQRIILRLAPQEPQELANYLVDRPDRHRPLGPRKAHDNAAAVVGEVPALIAA